MSAILSQEKGFHDSEGPPIMDEAFDEYEYVADVRAWEAFSNILRKYGVALREGDRRVTFRLEKLLDMKGMKEKGMLWSYAVAKVNRIKELIEVG